MQPANINHTKVDQAITAVRQELRWPALLTILAICLLYFLLPESLTFGPTWLLPTVTFVLLFPTVIAQRSGKFYLNFVFGVVLLSIVTAGLCWSLGVLIWALLQHSLKPDQLLRSAVALWISNVLVFASWYWRLDAGGPNRRATKQRHVDGAFVFPQMALLPGSPLCDPAWKPEFIDYLFLAFNTSTAFSPTDVPVLDRWAKVLMMIQSSISLATVAILAARAINIL